MCSNIQGVCSIHRKGPALKMITIIPTESFTATCEENSIRLVGGASELEGRVEVCVNGDWGTITSTGWDEVDASITCTHLGFSPLGELKIVSSRVLTQLKSCTNFLKSKLTFIGT